MSEDQPCKVHKRLDLKIQDLGYLEQLLSEQDATKSNNFCFFTSLGEELKFVRVRKGLWVNDYNITIKVPV